MTTKPQYTVRLRLNTKSTGDHDRWRLEIDGIEHVTPGVKFYVRVWTAAIIIETGEMKWCIEAEAFEVKFAPNGSAIVV